MTREERIQKLMGEKNISYEEAAKIVDQELMDSYDYEFPSLTEDDKKKLSERARKERFQKYANTKIFQDLASNFQDLVKKEEKIEVEETYDDLEAKLANSKHAKKENDEQDTIDETQRIVPTVDTTKEITSTVKELSDEELEEKISRAKHVKVKNTKKAKPKLIKKWKEMSTKKKVLSVVGVLVAAGVIIGAIGTAIASGDTSSLQNINDAVSNSDSATFHNVINQFADKGNELMSNFHSMADNLGNAISNTDASVINGQELANVDLSSQPVDMNMFNGEGQEVYYTQADAVSGANELTTNQDYDGITHRELIGVDGNNLNVENLSQNEYREALDSGNYIDAVDYADGVPMGHHTIEQSIDQLNNYQAGQTGGRTL